MCKKWLRCLNFVDHHHPDSTKRAKQNRIRDDPGRRLAVGAVIRYTPAAGVTAVCLHLGPGELTHRASYLFIGVTNIGN